MIDGPITTCSHCSRLYCEVSEEESAKPDRLCHFCFQRGMKHPGKCKCELCLKAPVYHAKFRSLREGGTLH